MENESLPRDAWRQVDGDRDPFTYGGTLARWDGDAIELRKLQPVREYVGDAEAADVGFAFWTREAWYDASDLREGSPYDLAGALQYIGAELLLDGRVWFGGDAEPLDAALSALALACALLDYGAGVDEGPAGWSADVLPEGPIYGLDGKPWPDDAGADADREFRCEILGDHEADPESIVPADRTPWTVDVECQHCGARGTAVVDLTTLQW